MSHEQLKQCTVGIIGLRENEALGMATAKLLVTNGIGKVRAGLHFIYATPK